MNYRKEINMEHILSPCLKNVYAKVSMTIKKGVNLYFFFLRWILSFCIRLHSFANLMRLRRWSMLQISCNMPPSSTLTNNTSFSLTLLIFAVYLDFLSPNLLSPWLGPTLGSTLRHVVLRNMTFYRVCTNWYQCIVRYFSVNRYIWLYYCVFSEASSHNIWTFLWRREDLLIY